jgi:hypothetical protein
MPPKKEGLPKIKKSAPASATPKVDINVNTKDDSLKELIEKNIKWSQVLYEQNKKIKRRLTLMSVASYLRLLIFVVPIILGIIYLPPLMADLFAQYGNILGSLGIGGNVTGGVNPVEILNQIQSGASLDEILSQFPAGQQDQIMQLIQQ